MFNILFSFIATASERVYVASNQHTNLFMNLDRFIAHEHAGFIWLIIAVLFLFFEIGTPGLFFFVAFALGSVCAGVAAFLGFALLVQCMVALISSLLIFFLFKTWLFVENHAAERTNVDALVGSHGIVTVCIEPRKPGRVKIRSEQWPAHVQDGTSLQTGTHVEVVKVRGNRVIVQGLKK